MGRGLWLGRKWQRPRAIAGMAVLAKRQKWREQVTVYSDITCGSRLSAGLGCEKAVCQ